MEKNRNTISGSQLAAAIDYPDTQIIDIRPIDSYNGWSFFGEKRPGHIKNARSLPFKWFKYIDWIEIVRHKQILPEHKIVIYGHSEVETEKAAQQFIAGGYNHVSIYENFIQEWTADESLPMQRLERYKNLVSAKWVNDLINDQQPPSYDNDEYVLVHTHYRNRDAYLSGHIPGAIDIDTNDFESTETWNRRAPEELEKALLSHGITANTTVVLYGKFMFPDNNHDYPGSAAGDLGAIRLAMIMLYAGVKDVRVLNGGFQTWTDAGYNVSIDDVKKISKINFGVEIPVHRELFVDTPEAKDFLKNPNAELVSVRSWPEFIGEVSGYNYIEAKGRIPGVIFGDCGSDAYHMENYRNVDHTTREFHEIESFWIEKGITPDKKLAFYCGTGWRGSEACFNGWLMGWPDIAVYDGGWFEWSNDKNNPYETGVPDEI